MLCINFYDNNWADEKDRFFSSKHQPWISSISSWFGIQVKKIFLRRWQHCRKYIPVYTTRCINVLDKFIKFAAWKWSYIWLDLWYQDFEASSKVHSLSWITGLYFQEFEASLKVLALSGFALPCSAGLYANSSIKKFICFEHYRADKMNIVPYFGENSMLCFNEFILQRAGCDHYFKLRIPWRLN